MNWNRQGRWQTATGAVLALILCGCGGPKTYPVSGKVVYPDGKPLNEGLVEFESMDPAQKQVNARGLVDKNGNFRLKTVFPLVNKEYDGAVEGEHKALVIPRAMTDEEIAKGMQPYIDPKFRQFETSGLKFTVKPGNNEIKITVTKP